MQKTSVVWLLVAAIMISEPANGEPAEAAIAKSDDSLSNTSSQTPSVRQEAAAATGLDELISRAIEQSPKLKASGSAVRSAQGELDQSSAWSNPELSIEGENLAGSGDYRGTNSSEITFGVSKEIELGGKISARQNIAARSLEISRLDHAASRRDLIRDVTLAYAEVVAAEEILALASDQKNLADDVLKSVSKRVGAAASPLVQKSRAEVELFTTEIALATATRQREAARKDLAGLLGEEELTPPIANTAFYNVDAPTNEITTLSPDNPELKKLDKSLERANAELDLEKANSVPNLNINLGVRQLRETGDQAFVLGTSLPVPVFDANRGNIEAARHRILQLESENQVLRTTQKINLAKARAEMLDAFRRTEILRTKILPSAEEAFRLSREGYDLGRFPYIEVLDAQRSLFGVKQHYIEAIKEYQFAKAEAERISATGSNITDEGVTHAE